MTETPVEPLLVEDNLSDAELTLRVFKKYNLTVRTKVAGDGAEALEFLFGPDGQRSEHLAISTANDSDGPETPQPERYRGPRGIEGGSSNEIDPHRGLYFLARRSGPLYVLRTGR